MLEAQELNNEIQEFLSEEPDFKPHEEVIRTWASTPEYSKIPIKQIAYAALGEELLKLGAKKARQADEEAEKSEAGGGTNRQSGKKNYTDMSDEEFEEELQNAKSGG